MESEYTTVLGSEKYNIFFRGIFKYYLTMICIKNLNKKRVKIRDEKKKKCFGHSYFSLDLPASNGTNSKTYNRYNNKVCTIFNSQSSSKRHQNVRCASSKKPKNMKENKIGEFGNLRFLKCRLSESTDAFEEKGMKFFDTP